MGKFQFKTCSVSEHSIGKLAEQKVRSVSKSQEADGILKIKLYIAGFQTILELIGNNFNNLLFDYSYGCSQVNPSMMKLIFLNLLRIGRNNCLASDGPITMLKNPGMLLDLIAGLYRSYSEWSARISKALIIDDSCPN